MASVITQTTPASHELPKRTSQ